MKKMKYLFVFIFFYFIFNFNIKADNVGCTYVRESYQGALELEEKIVVPLDMDGKTKKTSIGNYIVIFHNNSVASEYNNPPKNAPLLRINGKLMSAVDYYNTYNTCPNYFFVDMTGGSFEVNGYFMDNKDNVFGSYVLYSVEQKEYDENLELKDEIYICNLYSSSEEYADYEIQLQINYTKKTISINNEATSIEGKKAMDKYKKNFDFSDANKNKCPVNDLKVCAFGSVNVYPKDYEDSAIKNICAVLDLSEKMEVGNSYCGFFVTYLNKMEEEKDKSKTKEYLNILNNFCSQIIQHKDYDVNKTSCLYMCLNKYHYFGEDTPDTGECGFSGRLMVWFSNILRWIKYILPVAVIILAILDFIKAIGADKDDEMKKAQGRFMKRLIAAALVFIIPLIIEFVLDKMGFGYDDCGLF